jgi:hypothetical protein
MTDRYPFCSGARLDRARLEAARDAAYGAGANLATATVFDGVSDLGRDDALEAAEANLRDALFHLQALRQPEPPKVAPPERVDMIGMARVFGARL